MDFTRRDLGYTIYSRLEEALRLWLRDRLLNLFGPNWQEHIPEGIWAKILPKLSVESPSEVEDPAELLDETDIPDLSEIICFGSNLPNYLPGLTITRAQIQDYFDRLYIARNTVAHVKNRFTVLDLDELVYVADEFAQLLPSHTRELTALLSDLRTRPQEIVLRMPSSFVLDELPLEHVLPNNLPPPEYDVDGGFVGRQEDLRRIKNLLLGRVHRVVTISGAGGVGKTAVAQRICEEIVRQRNPSFDAVVWVSAKEERLTVTGIEPIEPSVRTYEDLLHNIMAVFGIHAEDSADVSAVEDQVLPVIDAAPKGLLLVVDNLETIRDERIKEFLKDLPPPNKALITSRFGLGEVERRYPLTELAPKEAVALFRTVAREKGAMDLARLRQDLAEAYVERMFRYPLIIKWVIGLAALGKDLELALRDLGSPSGDVARFSFEHIFEFVLDDDARAVLYALAASEGPVVPGVLAHITDFSSERLQRAVADLTTASLVIPIHEAPEGSTTIETRYELLSLTKNYIRAKLQERPDVYRPIQRRLETVQTLVEEAERAGRSYRYSLRNMGAESEAEKIAAVHAYAAFNNFEAGDYEGAVTEFRTATEIAPTFAAAYRNWALMESRAGFFDKAEELMHRAAELASDDVRVWFHWGNIEKDRGELTSAAKYLERAADLAPSDAIVYGALGDIEKRRGNHDRADELLRKALSLTPPNQTSVHHDVISYTALADNARRWGEALEVGRQTDKAAAKLQEAVALASTAASLDAADQRAQDTLREASLALGRTLLRTGNSSAAETALRKAIKDGASRPSERRTTRIGARLLAELLLERGERDEANAVFLIGRNALLDNDKYAEQYRSLEREFEGTRNVGRLTRAVADKGYGFISSDELSRDAFVHISEVLPPFDTGDLNSLRGRVLSFVVVETPRGLEARRVRVIAEAAADSKVNA